MHTNIMRRDQRADGNLLQNVILSMQHHCGMLQMICGTFAL